LKSLSSRTFLLEFWKERGEKLMTCHLFLDNFLRIYDLWVVFKGFKCFETKFSFKKTQISQFWYHEMFVLFWILSFAKDVLLQKIDCVFVLAIRGLLHMIKNFVLWCDFYVKSLLRNLFFEKFSLRRHYHGVVENMCSFSKSYL